MTTSNSIAPLPWTVVTDQFEGEEWLWLDDANGKAICGFSDPDDGIDDEDRANAAYIVLAVNTLPALVTALDQLVNGTPDKAAWTAARAALAAAHGED